MPPAMTIALVGASGQLGQDLLQTLVGTVVPLDRATVDLARRETIAPALEALRPDWVVNCAAYNLVDQAETEPAAAFAVNALGVRELARCCAAHGCALVHFSSDHVFGMDSARSRPYRETDCPGPVSVYGTSKLAGECFVRALCPQHLVIRTCGLYGQRGTGGKGTNFVETILRRAADGALVRVVNDQRCTPTATADLARSVADLMATRQQGTYHMTAVGECTWYEFAQAILAETGSRAELIPVSTGEYGAAARRPGYSVLDCTAYDRLGLHPRRRWPSALQSYLAARSQR